MLLLNNKAASQIDGGIQVVLLHPKMSVYLPPEQKPMAPTLPFESDWLLR